MRIKTMMRTAGVISLAVVAGLLGVGGTWALWNVAVPAEMGTVQAADFRVELNGSPMTVNGMAATVALEKPGTALTPKTPVYSIITVKNAANAGGRFSIRATMGTPTAQSSDPILAANLKGHVLTAQMPGSTTCADATYTAQPATATIAKGATARYCVKMSLPADTPAMLTPSTATVTIPVTATQIQ
ncbi:hypothetical protein GCM10010977_17560 [Citricoccus zhacaiensis]|uniref:Ribosomally synthesized peptide with SipW-like signal peptide n=1 Tax=Citricoccus zhacaiensis TaxID=489142 RepID=A0ABQ2M005_9MICC|nr:hypothetical protein [Citricoccus zhacaiensis]GGO45248.1 hypothetical protein GCM10010977_17560 [Citricoccus zhacaiensis]